MIKKLGALTLGAVNLSASVAFNALSKLSDSYTEKLGEFKSRLQTITSPMAMPSPADLAASLALNVAMYDPLKITALLAALAPSVSASIVDVSARIVLVTAAMASIKAAVSTGGIYAYVYEGTSGQIGAELQASVSTDHPTDSPFRAVILAANTEAGWSAIKATVRTS